MLGGMFAAHAGIACLRIALLYLMFSEASAMSVRHLLVIPIYRSSREYIAFHIMIAVGPLNINLVTACSGADWGSLRR